MRLRFFLVLVVLAGVSFAQDTNFSEGPQYLITGGGSPMFFRSLATPSLSFSPGLSDPYSGAELVPSHMNSSYADNSENVYLGEVYWGEHKPSEIAARRIETPSMTAEQTADYYHAVTEQAANALAGPVSVPIEQPSPPSVIEMASTNNPSNLPPSIVNSGVTGTADMQSLLNRGYGISLADFARSLKSKKRPAQRVFTNEDLQRK
jgi:hypothetical protein